MQDVCRARLGSSRLGLYVAAVEIELEVDVEPEAGQLALKAQIDQAQEPA